jgi:hypothetical protein
LTTVSDERSGKPALISDWLERPLRAVLFNPAPSRGPVGSITLQAKVLSPYARALRVGGVRQIYRSVGRVQTWSF